MKDVLNTYLNINDRAKSKYVKLFFAVLILYIFNIVTAASQQLGDRQQSKIKAAYVEGEILVRFKSNMSTQRQQSLVASISSNPIKLVSNKMKLSKIKLKLGNGVSTAIEEFKNNPNIEYVQPNYIYNASALPNDTSFNTLWGMKNTGQTVANSIYSNNNPGTTGYDIDVESAWDEITDCRAAVVAVLDTGINYTHEDLNENMWDGSGTVYLNHGYDFVDDDDDPMPTGAREDHGTHVAGIIGAVGNNSSGVAGVCWQASIMSVRVLGADGSGTVADIVQGIEFAVDNGAKVINMSLGGEHAFDFLYNEAISYARTNDVVVVVAAGNGGSDGVSDNNDGFGGDGNNNTSYQPCSFSQDNLLCVAALDQSYSLASFSNYGSTSVDIGAPGTNVLSSYAGQQLTDDFTTDWLAVGGGWATGICSSRNTLYNPSDWCSDGFYVSNADDRYYKSFNLNGALAAEMSYYAQVHTELNYDFFSTAISPSGGDPFSGEGSLLLNTSVTDFGSNLSHDISACNTSTCTLGFSLTTDSSNVDFGVAVDTFEIRTLQTNSTSYYSASGTSMSAPHVAGIATMIRAYNPNYTYSQTVEAIKNGGETVAALSGKTATGRAANAMGSLVYITKPTGVTVVVQ